jgi:hypothetical protein
MSRKYKFLDNERLYFVSFAVINWIDLFIRNEYKEVIVQSIKFSTPAECPVKPCSASQALCGFVKSNYFLQQRYH